MVSFVISHDMLSLLFAFMVVILITMFVRLIFPQIICGLTLVMLNISMYYTPPQFLSCYHLQVENKNNVWRFI